MTDRSVTSQKQNSILDAARTVFSREGYADTSVDAVAAEAGIAKGTVYLYFKSKEELYLAAVLRDIRAFASVAREQMEHAPSLEEQIGAFLRVRLDYFREHRDFLRIYLTEYSKICAETPISKELRRLQRDNMHHLAGLIEDAIGRGEIRRVPAPALAAKLFDIARGLVERQLLGWKDFQQKDEIAFAIDLLWRGIERPQAAKDRKVHGGRKNERNVA